VPCTLYMPCHSAWTFLSPSCMLLTPFAACVLSECLAHLQLRPARGAQTAEIAAAKAAYEVTKQKAGEAYASTAEYLKEKVLPVNLHLSLDLCNVEASKVLCGCCFHMRACGSHSQ